MNIRNKKEASMALLDMNDYLLKSWASTNSLKKFLWACGVNI